MIEFVLKYLSEIIAFFALILSGFATIKSLKFKKNENELIEVQKKLNQLMLEKEKKDAIQAQKANLGANFITIGKHKHRLKIFNKGEAPAFNVQIVFPEGNNLVDEYSIEQKFPLEKMDSGQSVDLLAGFSSDTNRKLKIELIWQNEEGDSQKNILYPTL